MTLRRPFPHLDPSSINNPCWGTPPRKKKKEEEERKKKKRKKKRKKRKFFLLLSIGPVSRILTKLNKGSQESQEARKE